MFTETFADSYRKARDNGRRPQESWFLRERHGCVQICHLKPPGALTPDDWQDMLMIGARSDARVLMAHFLYKMPSGLTIQEAAALLMEPFKETIIGLIESKLVNLAGVGSCADQLVVILELFSRAEIPYELEKAEWDHHVL